jgi:glycosyltransferase involved in cell wall biosynthesis
MIETNGPGGAENMLVQLAVGLRQHGLEAVPVIRGARGPSWLEQRLRETGFDPEFATVRRAIDPGALGALRRMLKRRRVHLVHSHEFTMGIYGRAANLATGRPHVVTMHGGTGFARRARRRYALGWALRGSDARVAVSDATADFLARACRIRRETIDVIPNGVGVVAGRADAVREELGLAEGDLLVLAVGNLYAVKGHRVLVEAAASLGRVPARWIVAIAGRGDEEGRLRALVAERGLEAQVRLLGLRRDIPDLLAAADVFVMPSLSEGLPLALLEAMMAGKPVVASAVGGIPSAVRSGSTGLLVPPNDPSALGSALRKLSADAELRKSLGIAAAADVRQRFGADSMTAAYIAVYERALADRI